MPSKGKGVIRPWVAVFMGCALSLIITGLLVLLFTKLILSGTLPVSWSGVIACTVTALAVLGGCTLTLCQIKSRKMLYALLSAGLYLALLTVGNTIILQGVFKNYWLKLGIVLAVALVCGLVGARKKKLRYHG